MHNADDLYIHQLKQAIDELQNLTDYQNHCLDAADEIVDLYFKLRSNGVLNKLITGDMNTLCLKYLNKRDGFISHNEQF